MSSLLSPFFSSLIPYFLLLVFSFSICILQGVTKKTTLNPNAKAFQSPKTPTGSVNSDTGDGSQDWADHDSGISVASSPQVAMKSQGKSK